jgi:hypothetical protein
VAAFIQRAVIKIKICKVDYASDINISSMPINPFSGGFIITISYLPGRVFNSFHLRGVLAFCNFHKVDKIKLMDVLA